MKVLTVVGNRPQFIKAAPLSIALREAGIDEISLHTGQHYDDTLSAIFYEELGLPAPAYALDLRSADPELVRSPIAAARVNGDGVYPSSQKWCSVSQTEPSPRPSAHTIWSSVSRYSVSNGRLHSSGFRKS